MGEGDLMPSGSHRAKPDPRLAKKIREGAKKADVIKKQMEAHHATEEIPTAEEELQKDLAKLNQPK